MGKGVQVTSQQTPAQPHHKIAQSQEEQLELTPMITSNTNFDWSDKHICCHLTDCQSQSQEIWPQYDSENQYCNDTKVISPVANIRRPIKTKVSCGCPNSKPGTINLDPMMHVASCWMRKRLIVERSSIVDTLVIPKGFNDGYRLGVSI